MALSPGTAAYLRALVAGAGGLPPLVADAGRLLDLVVAAVPSCLAVRVTVSRHGVPLPVTARAGQGVVRGSLALHLPRSPGDPDEPGPVVALWSGAPGVLGEVRRDWLTLLELDPARALLDTDLALPDEDDLLGSALADVATVDRALGALLEQRGLLPHEGLAHLRAEADAAGTTLLAAARAVLPPPR